MRKKQKILKLLDFPIFAVNYEGEYVLVSGGGGGKNYGIKSMLHVYSSKILENPVYSEDTGTDIVSSIELSQTKNWILTSRGKSTNIYSIQNGILQSLIKIQTDFHQKEPTQKHAVFTKDSTLFATGGNDGILRIWRISINSNPNQTLMVELDRELMGHSQSINCVAFSVDDRYVCSTSNDRTCRIFRMRTGEAVKKLTFGLNNLDINLNFRGCRYSPCGCYLYTVETQLKSSSFLTKWKCAPTYDPVESVKIQTTPCSSMNLSRNGEYLATGTADGISAIYNTKGLRKIKEAKCHMLPVTSLSFNKDNELLSVSADYSYEFLSSTGTNNAINNGRSDIVLWSFAVAIISIFVYFAIY